MRDEVEPNQFILKIGADNNKFFNVIDVKADGNCFYSALLCHPSFRSTFTNHAAFRQQLGTSILQCLANQRSSTATRFLTYVFDAVVGVTHSIPDLRSYVLATILRDGQWGDIFVALSILLLYPELNINIHIISSSMEAGDNNLPPPFVEMMNIGCVLRDLYDASHQNVTFTQFLSYDIDTCEQVYLLLGNSCSPFVQPTPTMPRNHYYYLQRLNISSIHCDTVVIDAPWNFDSDQGRSVTLSSLKQKSDDAYLAQNICFRKEMHAFQLKMSRKHETPKKHSVRKVSKNAASMAASRAQESPDARKKRTLRNAASMAASRAQESPDARKKRTLRNAASKAASHAQESPDARKKRTLRNAAFMAASRAQESPDARKKRTLRNAASKAASRAQESPDARKKRMLRNAASMAASRAQESPDARKKRMLRNAASKAASRAQESPDARKKRTLRNAASMAASRAQESPDARKKRTLRNAASMAASRAQESPDGRKKRTLRNAASMAASRYKTSAENKSMDNFKRRQKTVMRVHDRKLKLLSFSLNQNQVISGDTVNNSNVEHDIEAAVMLNYLNSGYHLFQEIDDDTEQQDRENTFEKSMMTDLEDQCCNAEDIDRIITDVRKSLGLLYHVKEEINVCRLITCASCGMRQFERDEIRYHRVSLSQLLCLKCSDEETRDFLKKKEELTIHLPCEDGSWKQFELWKLYSRFESKNGELYYLHPEFVEYCTRDRTYYCELCDACFTSLSAGIVPEFSIANNVDFGNIDRAGINEPTFLEAMCVSFVRIFVRVLNIKSINQSPQSSQTHNVLNQPNSVKLGAHCVAFYQENAEYQCLKNFDLHVILKNALHFHFLDENGNFDFLMRMYYASSIVQIRPHILYQYLKIEEQLNPLFRELNFKVPSFNTIKKQVKSISWDQISTMSQNPSICEVDNLFDVRHFSDIRDAPSISQEKDLGPFCIDNTSFNYSLVTEDLLSTIENFQEDDDGTHDSHIDYEGALRKKYLESIRVLLAQNNLCSRRRSANPVNEFEDNERLIAGAFPHIFLFGSLYGNKYRRGVLPIKCRHHLFFQYTTRPARCKELILLLSNQILRHSNLQSISLSLKTAGGRNEAVKEFFDFVNSDDFDEAIRDACDNPMDPCAQRITAMLLNSVLLTNIDAPCGLLCKRQNIANQYAIIRKYGLHSSFDTISLDLYNNLNVFRTGHKSSSNTSFPASCTDTNFVTAAQNNTMFEDYDCSLHQRINIANSNCIASIIEYGRFLENYARHMHGIRFDTNQYNGAKKRKSDCILHRLQGICGTTLAMAGANDTTSAGKMHAHLLRCSCPQPHIVTRVGHGSSRLCKTLVHVLGTQYHTEFDRSVHIFQLIHLFLQSLDQEHREYSYPYLRSSNIITPCLMDIPPSAVNEQHEFHAYEQIHSSRTQWHLHSFRCHQKSHGKDGCCSDYPRPVKDTGDPILLEPVFDIHNELESYIIRDYDADTERANTTKSINLIHNKEKLHEDLNIKDENEEMLLSLFESAVNHNGEGETRIINWDTQRRLLEELPQTESDNEMMNNIILAMNENSHLQSIVEGILAQLKANNHLRPAYEFINSRLKAANGSVVAYNKTFTACFGSNCAMYHLGTLNDSINAVHYMIPYPMEDSISLKKSLPILVHANSVWKKKQQNIQDRSQPEKHVKFLLQNVLNKLSSHLEFSDMFAAHIVLGGTQLLSTEHYVPCNVSDLLQYVERGKDFDLSLSGQRTLSHDGIETNENKVTSQARQRLQYSQIPCHKGLYHVKDAQGNVVHAPVAYAIHYTFRGSLLKNINRKEYTELIVVRPITQDDTVVTARQAGRPKNAVYLFDKDHPLSRTHCQAIRSKHGCLRLSCKMPKHPSFPCPDRLLQKDDYNQWIAHEANPYAAFMLTLFRPESKVWKGQKNMYGYTWKDFIQWLQELKHDNTWISYFRLQSFYRFSIKLKGDYKIERTTKAYKAKDRTLWNKDYKTHDDIRQHLQNQEEYKASEINPVDHEGSNEVNDVSVQLNHQKGPNLQTKMNMLRKMNFAQGQLKQMKKFLQVSTQNDTAHEDFRYQHGQKDIDLCSRAILYNSHDIESDLAMIHSIYQTLNEKESRLDPELPNMQHINLDQCYEFNNTGGSSTVASNNVKGHLDEFIKLKKFSTDKLFVAERYRDIFCDILVNEGVTKDVAIPLTFITGQAGAGKTYLLNAISEMSKITSSASKGALKLTHTGVAAANCGGYTLYILSIPITLNACGIDTTSQQAWKSLPIERLVQLQDQYDFKKGQYSMVILDEFPTIDPVNFTAIEKRISQLFPHYDVDETHYFAGLPTILAGDFCQHLPTKKAGMAQWIERKYKRLLFPHTSKPDKDAHIFRKGGFIDQAIDMFLNCDWIELTEQNRCKDMRQQELLDKMYNFQNLTISDLERYKLFSAEDVIDDPSWKFATILTLTNYERKLFEFEQAKRFAIEHNTVVVRWKSHNVAKSNNIRLDIDPDDPLQYEYFVVDAPAMLLYNVNTQKDLANGCDVILSSITLKSQQEVNFFQDQLLHAIAGDIITLHQVPASVNVEILYNSSSDLCGRETESNKQKRIIWKHQNDNYINKMYNLPSSDDRIIIPVIEHHSNRYTMYLQSRIDGHPQACWQCPSIPFYLTFAITSTKAQSKTLSKTILSLPSDAENQFMNPRLNIHDFNVNISRGSGKIDNVKLLLPSGATHKDLQYITKLKYEDAIQNLVNAFVPIATDSRIKRFNEDLYITLLKKSAKTV